MIWRREPREAVRELSPQEFRSHFPAAFAIFAAAMGYPESYIEPRIRLAESQLGFEAFTAFGAFRRSRLVGFAYGYRLSRGQWWTDEVARALALPGADSSRDWLAHSFELCEIHVAPAVQSRGLGRRLLRGITAAQPCPVMLLSTPTGPTKAMRFYRAEGYSTLASRFRFTGDRRDFEILGKVVR